jgi:hypothetical protein
MICHGSFRCDERRSLKTGWIVAAYAASDHAAAALSPGLGTMPTMRMAISSDFRPHARARAQGVWGRREWGDRKVDDRGAQGVWGRREWGDRKVDDRAGCQRFSIF